MKKKKKIRSIGYFLSFFFTLFLFGGMFSYTEVGAATRVFYDGFEDGTTNKWDPSGPTDRNRCASATSAVDGVVGAHAGIRMASCNWNGIVAWNDPNAYTTLSLNSWSYTNEMFIRFWIRLDQDMDNKDGAKLFRVGFGGDSDTFWQRDPVSLNGGTHEVWTVGGNGIINAWSPHNFEDRQWHKIEIYIKSDTGPNGAITVWMDGVLTRSYQYPYTGVTSTGTSRWYPFNLMSNWSNNPGWEHDDKNHVYWDDFEIYSDSSAGSPAIGSLSDATVQVSGSGDTTPPTSPTNLAANATSSSSISVSWNPATDNVGVTGYIVERCQGSGCSNFTQVGTPTASPFVDSGLTANTFYNYHVRATDAANNLSGWSNVVGATTQSATPVTTLTIDNTDAATSQSGSWSPSTNFPGYYGTNYHYSPNATGHWFEWTASTLSPGTYEVYAYWNANPDRPTDVSYLITHSGGTATRNNINQTQNGSQWNLLGTYTFGTTGTVRVQSGGTGTEGTVADAIRFVKTNTVACNTVTTANFSQSAYNSYGAPFDAFQTSTNLMNTQCNSADTHTVNLTTGITGDTTRIVYTKGYWYDAVTTAWRQYTGTCTGALNGEWCQGSVSATITDANISTANAANPTYLVGMTCSVQGGSWKCGCRDTACSNFSWQIQGAGL